MLTVPTGSLKPSITVNNGENTCKSPDGMFDDARIDNSLKVVKNAIIEYEN